MATTDTATPTGKAVATVADVTKGLSATSVRNAIGRPDRLPSLVKALDNATTPEDFATAFALAQREMRDAETLETLADQTASLAKMIGTARDAHLALRVAMVGGHIRFTSGWSAMSVAVNVLGLPENNTSKQTAQRVIDAAQIQAAQREWNAKAPEDGKVKVAGALEALKAVNAAGKAKGADRKVVDKAKRGEDIMPPTEPRPTTGATIVAAVESALTKARALKAGEALSDAQQTELRTLVVALLEWVEQDHSTVTVTTAATA